MSWVLVDGINEDALYEALDLAATDETPDPHDLGTSYVPLAGAALKSGGCAVFAKYAGDFRAIAMDKQRTEDARSKSGDWSVDYIFDVPLDTAAAITGYRHDRAIENDFFRNLRTLAPTNGNVLTKLSQPPGWWQTVGSLEYE